MSFVNESQRETARVIIKKRLNDNEYLGVQVTLLQSTGNAVIRIGDVGRTYSPLSFWKRMSVAVLRAKIDFPKSLDDKLFFVESDNADLRATVNRSGDLGTIKIESMLGQREIRFSNENLNSHLIQAFVEDMTSVYWYRLDNPFMRGFLRARASILKPINSADFRESSVGEFETEVGKPIVLSLMPALSGYVCLLVVDMGGKITMLYPNDLAASDARMVLQEGDPAYFTNVAFDGNITKGISGLDLTASSGPTHFVAIVSKERRSLLSFMPAGFGSKLVARDGNTPLNKGRVGPGVWNDLPEDSSPLESLDGSTWDVAHFSFNVVEHDAWKQ
jgi:hypothetical protein